MTTLLVDVGNTRIKWARLDDGCLGRQRAAAHEGWKARDFERHLFRRPGRVDRVLVASVAGDLLARRLQRAARHCIGVTPEFVASEPSAGGVTVGYVEPWRLGVDRFVAVIGAHHLSPRRAALVADIGTAMTLDLVDATGSHHGGAIVPGPQLMVESLLRGTSGIRRRARGDTRGSDLFARSTREAIEQGARHACAGTIEHALRSARARLGSRPIVFLTGGDAGRIAPLLSIPHQVVPDLVLRGLAVLAEHR